MPGVSGKTVEAYGSGSNWVPSLREDYHHFDLEGSTILSHGRIRAHISPKSMIRVQLLRKFNPDTLQWTDGVLTSTAVAVNAEL